jgi:hypothetical protein
MFRGLLYQSYRHPNRGVWLSGVALFVLMMATAFIGYVLPWGQMSFWGGYGACLVSPLFMLSRMYRSYTLDALLKPLRRQLAPGPNLWAASPAAMATFGNGSLVDFGSVAALPPAAELALVDLLPPALLLLWGGFLVGRLLRRRPFVAPQQAPKASSAMVAEAINENPPAPQPEKFSPEWRQWVAAAGSIFWAGTGADR